MNTPIALRTDHDSDDLRRLARASKNAAQTRRLLALAAIYDGATRSAAARVGGVTVQIVRDWVLKFNALGADGLIDRKTPGPTPRLDDARRAALKMRLDGGPDPTVDGVVRWRLVDLVKWLAEVHDLAISVQTLSRELRAMGYRKLSARPRHHAQTPGAIAAFKKTSPRNWQRSRKDKPMASL